MNAKKSLLFGLGMFFVIALVFDALRITSGAPAGPVSTNQLQVEEVIPKITATLVPVKSSISEIEIRVQLYEGDNETQEIVTDIEGNYLRTVPEEKVDYSEDISESEKKPYQDNTETISDNEFIYTSYYFTPDNSAVLKIVDYAMDYKYQQEIFFGNKTGNEKDLKPLISYPANSKVTLAEIIGFRNNQPLLYESFAPCTNDVCEGFSYAGTLYTFTPSGEKVALMPLTIGSGGFNPTSLEYYSKDIAFLRALCCGGALQYRIDFASKTVTDLYDTFFKYGAESISGFFRSPKNANCMLFPGKSGKKVALYSYDFVTTKVTRVSDEYESRLNVSPYLYEYDDSFSMSFVNDAQDNEIIAYDKSNLDFLAHIEHASIVVDGKSRIFINNATKKQITPVDFELKNSPYPFDKGEILEIIVPKS